jgi:hypothetical protein
VQTRGWKRQQDRATRSTPLSNQLLRSLVRIRNSRVDIKRVVRWRRWDEINRRSRIYLIFKNGSAFFARARGDRQFCQGAFLPLARTRRRLFWARVFRTLKLFWRALSLSLELASQTFLPASWLADSARADKTHYLAAHFCASVLTYFACGRSPLILICWPGTNSGARERCAGPLIDLWCAAWAANQRASECALQWAPRWYLQERHQIKWGEVCASRTRPICRSLSVRAQNDVNSVEREGLRSFAKLWETARWIHVAVKPNLSCDLRCHWCDAFNVSAMTFLIPKCLFLSAFITCV